MSNSDFEHELFLCEHLQLSQFLSKRRNCQMCVIKYSWINITGWEKAGQDLSSQADPPLPASWPAHIVPVLTVPWHCQCFDTDLILPLVSFLLLAFIFPFPFLHPCWIRLLLSWCWNAAKQPEGCELLATDSEATTEAEATKWLKDSDSNGAH